MAGLLEDSTSTAPTVGSHPDNRDRKPWLRYGPWAAVTLVVAWSLWSLRATLVSVAYLDDASVHEQMVRAATSTIRSGHNPLTSWFPYLGEGSPQFLHYQSLGAMVTGLFGTMVGADTAFRWSLYLLLALWPAVIFVSARILRIGPAAAAVAAVLSPMVMSVPSVGYEHGAYLWIGYGLWAQLWASWTLPLAWAFTWRALENPRFLLPAALCIALTAGFHYETGYLAFLAVVVLPFASPSELPSRLRRGVILLAGSLLASAWVWIPLVVFGKWAAINGVLSRTPLVNGYGARQVLSWLFAGQVYDAGRFPVVSLAVLAGIVTCIVRWRIDPLGRALLLLWSLCLLLTFGRTTFGSLVSVIPGSSDIFFRRFLMGTQLAGLLLAGIGVVASASLVMRVAKSLSARWYDADRDRRIAVAVLVGTVGVLVVVAFATAPLQVSRFDARNSGAVHTQQAGQESAAPEIAPLIAYVERHGGGRVYAGMPTNWGTRFTVGEVPVFKYLESRDVDEVGYTLRTASLMTDPEYYFDQDNPGDYTVFGIRYLLLPADMVPPVAASPVLERGPYKLWEISANGYLDLVDTVGVVSANRFDVAARTLGMQRSSLVQQHEDLVVAFAGAPAQPLSAGGRGTGTLPAGPPGTIAAQPRDLTGGKADVLVRLTRPAVVLLSASFDPGWQVTVDGQSRPVQMLAPAVIGVAVGAGVHRVVFTYTGFAWYPELVVLGLLALVVLGLLARRPFLGTAGHRLDGPPEPAGAPESVIVPEPAGVPEAVKPPKPVMVTEPAGVPEAVKPPEAVTPPE